MLLVDQPVNKRIITECINIKEKTNIHVRVILLTFGYQQTDTTIESYVVTNLTNAVKAVMSYYK